MTEGLRRALARLGQPDQLPWSPSGRSRGSRIPGTRSRSWPSGAARLRQAAAAWSQRYDPLLRHGVQGADGMGSLGYQTGTSEPPPDEHGPATCPEWLITKQAAGLAMLCGRLASVYLTCSNTSIYFILGSKKVAKNALRFYHNDYMHHTARPDPWAVARTRSDEVARRSTPPQPSS